MSSVVLQYREMESNLAALIERRDEMKPGVQDRLDLIELVKGEALAKGFDLKEIALELCPELSRNVTGSPALVKKRQPRKVKVYTNPYTGKVIETKGGNHTELKQWKLEHGNDVVEGWAKI